MTHQELLNTPEYWTTKIQIELYRKVEEYLAEHQMSRSDFAKKLGVSKGYISQLLNGDFDHRISKLVELALFIGYDPVLELRKKTATNQEKANLIVENVCKSLEEMNFTAMVSYKSKLSHTQDLNDMIIAKSEINNIA